MGNARWAQLTYASFDADSGSSGGWQVRQRSGDLSPAEVENIKSSIVTNFDPIEPPPQFPSPDDLARMPRRLAYLPLDDAGGWAYWHAVPAGVDGTGRPGNVFTHVLVDRYPADPVPPFRPIDRWCSPTWLVPFGPRAVLEADLPSTDEAFAPSTIVDRDAVIRFLLDPTQWRGTTMSVLLDAAATAIAGGPPVVIAAASSDDAGLWIAAVSALMAPVSARRLAFSVFERAGAVDSVVRKGAHLIGIHHDDVQHLTSSNGVVLIDDRVTPALGDLDGAGHEVGGSLVEVTPWSVMSQEALLDPELAARVFAHIDEISSRVPIRLAPAWPLAMAVALHPDELADARTEASRVLRADSPEELRDDSELWAAAAAATEDGSGPTTEAAWNDVAAIDREPRSIMMEFAAARYYDRALNDLDWLTRSRPAPACPPSEEAKRAAVAAIPAAIRAIERLEATGEPTVAHAFGATRLLDFAQRTGILAELPDAPVERIITEHIAPVIFDRQRSPELMNLVASVSPALVSEWIKPVIEHNLGPRAAELDDLVLAWLVPAGSREVFDLEGGLSPLGLAAVLSRARRHDPSGHPYRSAALIRVLESNETATDNARFNALLHANWPWTAREAFEIEAAHPLHLPVAVLRNVLMSSPSGADITDLAAEILRTADHRTSSPEIEALASLRMVIGDGGLSAFVRSSSASRLYDQVILTSGHIDELHVPAIDLEVVLSYYLVALAEPTRIQLPPERTQKFLLLSARTVTPARFAEAIRILGERNLLPGNQFARIASIVVRTDSGAPLRPRHEHRLLGALPLNAPEGARFVEVIADFLASKSVDIDGDLDRASRYLYMDVSEDHGRAADRTFSEFDKFARPFWKHYRAVAPQSDGRNTRLFGGFGSSREKF